VKRAEKEVGAHVKEVDAAKAALAREEDRNVELASKLDNLKDEACAWAGHEHHLY
jgi:hypothetical protein